MVCFPVVVAVGGCTLSEGSAKSVDVSDGTLVVDLPSQ